MEKCLCCGEEIDKTNEYLQHTPWSGHRNFAYTLTHLLKPNIIVELGTHYGTSFTSFCQAIKDMRNDKAKLYTVDTWKGDPQTGFYGEEIIERLKADLDVHYSNLNIELIRDHFINAKDRFENNSIDILHIDGYHNYNNLKEDFETWLPKVAKGGCVLFHDIAEDCGYESAIYWKELKEKYQYYFEFTHGWGLGVLFPKRFRIYRG